MIAFLDASALIYLLEGAEPFGTRARAALAAPTAGQNETGIAVSRLSWLECRVQPIRDGRDAALAAYDEFFARRDLTWIDLNRDVIELATVIRVSHGLRTPDALQAASCLQLGPDHRFLTGDKSFAKVAGLSVIALG